MADLASRITKPDEAETPVQDAGNVEEAQVDGAGANSGGSGLQDVAYDVEVSLNDLQRDESTPFGSVHSFQELGLYAAIFPSSCSVVGGS